MKMKKTVTFLILFIFMPLQISAEESIIIDDWLITSDNTACWASALITEDPVNDEYNPKKDFQLTVSFHNRVPLPQFTITSVTVGKAVTSASVKFNKVKLDFVVDDGTAFSLPKDDRDIIFFMLDEIIPYVILSIDNKEIQPTPSVSLKGFKKAYNIMSKQCDFDKLPKAARGIS
jgi:hypothetical protein